MCGHVYSGLMLPMHIWHVGNHHPFSAFAYIFPSIDSSRSTLSVFGILPPGTASRRRLRVQSIVTHQCRENSAAKGRQMFTWVLGSGGWEPEH
ncbi:uncharacterized protein SEPMUDRAFT_151065 [Sphaerulina musiva SO2202]|uniref:Uncharacterized protein n=1 Tax=Sphaerulina musiva (strain SO2202) TaxID=692275 RepID=M3BTN6_SPHMS|nr:uncharacterized protein SEPMUDRAFT_151065 [Sphaerulina musiva SO2202]EMF09990.1 hypothetical protein SEPMUDRAFT_151065 [Sphaerulina musiva SO2202]